MEKRFPWEAIHRGTNLFSDEIELTVISLGSEGFIGKTPSLLPQAQPKPNLKHRCLFNKLARIAATTVFADCINKLQVLKTLIGEYSQPSWMDLYEYRPLEDRFAMTEENKKRMEEEIYETVPYTDMHKLLREICFAITMYDEVACEVFEVGTYRVLKEVMSGLAREEEDSVHLEQLDIQHAQELAEIGRKVEREKKISHATLGQLTNEIIDLKTQLQDLSFQGQQEVRYAYRWQNARCFQHDLMLTLKENAFTDVIEEYTLKIDHENRIHKEIHNFIGENMEDLTSDIEYWMQKYDEELERRDQLILTKRLEWDELHHKHAAMQDVMAEHNQFIIDRKLELKERKRLAKLLKKQIKAAIKLQAWWRGLLVRLKIGPYKWLKKFYRQRKIELAEIAAEQAAKKKK